MRLRTPVVLHRSSGSRPWLGAPLLIVALSACESSTSPIRVEIQPVTIEAVGDVVQLEAAVTGSTRLPEWESLDPHVVTVTRAGMAVAVGEGTGRVIARVGSGQGEGTVHVLPAVSMEVTAATKEAEEPGLERIRLELVNTGGRGFYRIRTMRDPEVPGGESTIVSDQWNDLDVAPGSSFFFIYSAAAPVDWVVVYSRSPHSQEYRRTACVRFDGGPCPLP